jgi:hypothetical protein
MYGDVTTIPAVPSVFADFRTALIRLCRDHDVEMVRPPANVFDTRQRSPAHGPEGKARKRLRRQLQRVPTHTYLSPVRADGTLENIWGQRSVRRNAAEEFHESLLAAEAAANEMATDGFASLQHSFTDESALFITADPVPGESTVIAASTLLGATSRSPLRNSRENISDAYAKCLRGRTKAPTPQVKETERWMEVIQDRDLSMARRQAATPRRVYTTSSTGQHPSSASAATRRAVPCIHEIRPPASTVLGSASADAATRLPVTPVRPEMVEPTMLYAERGALQRDVVRLRSRLGYQPPEGSISTLPPGLVGAPMAASPYTAECPSYYRAQLESRSKLGVQHRHDRHAHKGTCSSSRTAQQVRLATSPATTISPPRPSRLAAQRSRTPPIAGTFTVPAFAIPRMV